MVGSLRTPWPERCGERTHLWQIEGGGDGSDTILSARKKRDGFSIHRNVTKLLTPRNGFKVVFIVWNTFL